MPQSAVVEDPIFNLQQRRTQAALWLYGADMLRFFLEAAGIVHAASIPKSADCIPVTFSNINGHESVRLHAGIK